MGRLPRWLERLLYGKARLPIPHGPELTGEPSGYVEPPMPPMRWEGQPGDVDYIAPADGEDEGRRP